MTQEIKTMIEGIQTAFDEYKKTNDARIEAVKAGNGTADFDAKLARIDAVDASAVKAAANAYINDKDVAGAWQASPGLAIWLVRPAAAHY